MSGECGRTVASLEPLPDQLESRIELVPNRRAILLERLLDREVLQLGGPLFASLSPLAVIVKDGDGRGHDPREHRDYFEAGHGGRSFRKVRGDWGTMKEGGKLEVSTKRRLECDLFRLWTRSG